MLNSYICDYDIDIHIFSSQGNPICLFLSCLYLGRNWSLIPPIRMLLENCMFKYQKSMKCQDCIRRLNLSDAPFQQIRLNTKFRLICRQKEKNTLPKIPTFIFSQHMIAYANFLITFHIYKLKIGKAFIALIFFNEIQFFARNMQALKGSSREDCINLFETEI